MKWDDEYKKELQDIAEGKIDLDEYKKEIDKYASEKMQDGAFKRQAEILYGTGKKIFIADIPSNFDQPREKRFDYNYKEDRLNNTGKFISALQEADFDKALEVMAERFKIESDLILKREEYIKKAGRKIA